MNVSHIKLIIAIILDILDFTLGRVFGLGDGLDVVFAVIAVALFGWKGLFQLWEVVDVTNQIDGFVPTLTLLALADMRNRKKEPPQIED